MKRMFSLILAVLLTLSMLAGCGGQKTPETTAPVNPPETTAPDAAPEFTAPVPETTEPALEERPLALGVVEGDTYTNTYAGFGCTLGSGWTIIPADQLQELPVIVPMPPEMEAEAQAAEADEAEAAEVESAVEADDEAPVEMADEAVSADAADEAVPAEVPAEPAAPEDGSPVAEEKDFEA